MSKLLKAPLTLLPSSPELLVLSKELLQFAGGSLAVSPQLHLSSVKAAQFAHEQLRGCMQVCCSQ